MPYPCKDPITGYPMKAPGDASKRPVRITTGNACCATTCTFSFTAATFDDLSACDDESPVSITMTYSDVLSSAWGAEVWVGDNGGNCAGVVICDAGIWTLSVYLSGWDVGTPTVWQSLPVSNDDWNCSGDTVTDIDDSYSYSTVPATITVTGAC